MKSIPILLFVVCMAMAVQQGIGRDVDSLKGGVQEQFWGIWGRPGYWGWPRPLPVVAPPPNAFKCHAAVDGVYACLRKVMTPFWITRRDYTLHDCCSTLDNFKTQCKSLYVYTREAYIFPHSLLDQCSSAPPQPPQPSHIPIPKPPHIRPVPPHVIPAPSSPAPSPSSDDSDLVPTPSSAPSPSSDDIDVPIPSTAPSPSSDDDSDEVPTPSPAPSPSSDDDFDDIPMPSPAPSPSSDDDSDDIPTPSPAPLPSSDDDSDDIPTPSPAPSPSSENDSDEVPTPSPAPSPSSDDSDEVPTPAPSPEEA